MKILNNLLLTINPELPVQQLESSNSEAFITLIYTVLIVLILIVGIVVIVKKKNDEKKK